MADIFLASRGRDAILRELKPRTAQDDEFMWVDLNSDDGASVLKRVYGCHPLIIEHVENGIDRPRVSTYDKWNYIAFSAVAAEGCEERLNLIPYCVWRE
ncbi:MAG: hypothetical protein Q8S19_00675, partial [Bacillota bacterium]|nr:hypothetical protein [Bacillota bacterium]